MAFDLQMNPANPGLSFHKLDKAKDKNFWSVRVNLDVRIIVHRTAESFLLCYVDHHDKAYDWAERRKPVEKVSLLKYRCRDAFSCAASRHGQLAPPRAFC